ncbi:MAG: DUF4424 family protein [Fimbriimonas ginsengisoli]|uniref:DUF4424 family protein n=1 Tax=Fimbriimonas ginsengisoli TaxID=1005039 RepID=A0A931LR66_FIMGI|nr:DUF4424 family protein [Fimbriimonas ginsengisoli]
MICLAPLVAMLAATFDDGFLVSGGAPRLQTNGTATVRMVSEDIDAKISDHGVDVTCRFVFRNEGPACTVRMGFPDETPPPDNYSMDSSGRSRVYHGLEGFRTTVDGRSVRTKIEATTTHFACFHTKWVHFEAGQRHTVVDRYHHRMSGGVSAIASEYDPPEREPYCYLKQFEYILHTGATWKGPIGSVRITVKFDRKHMPGQLRVMSEKELGQNAFNYPYWPILDRAVVVYSGLPKPTVAGRTLVFETNNLKPTKQNDLELYFEYSPYW